MSSKRPESLQSLEHHRRVHETSFRSGLPFPAQVEQSPLEGTVMANQRSRL